MLNFTKDQLLEAILYFAKKIGKYERFKDLIESGITMPELVKIIVYNVFVYGDIITEEENFSEYNLIWNYAQEIEEKGFVTFK